MKRSNFPVTISGLLFAASFVVLAACSGGVDYGQKAASGVAGSAGEAGAGGATDAGTGGEAGSDKPTFCDPGSTVTCKCDGETGTKKCKDDGSAYGDCSCKSDAGPDGSDGSPNVCDPGSTKACKCGDLNGVETCKDDGSGYGACVCSMVCTPGEIKVTNCCADGKSGAQQCKADGSGYGDCMYCNATPDAGVHCGPYDVGQVIVSQCCPGGKDGKQVCQDTGVLSGCLDCPPDESHKYYADDDGDGDGDPNDTVITTSSTPPAGHVDHDGDCDDHDDAVFNGSTNACDCAGGGHGTRQCINGGWTACVGCQSTQYTYFRDADGDGLGDPANKQVTTSSTPPTGYVTNADDCDDTNAAVKSTGSRSCVGAGNCSGTQECVNGVWGSCACSATYTYYRDADNDGLGDAANKQASSSSTPPTGYVANSNDCDDTKSSVGASGNRSCVGAGNCSGTQTCANGVWSSCVCAPTEAGANRTVSCTYTVKPGQNATSLRFQLWDMYDMTQGNGTTPAGCVTTSGTSVNCTFTVKPVNKIILQVQVGTTRYWGDTSGWTPAPCIPESQWETLTGSSITILGTLSCTVDGLPASMGIEPNVYEDPNWSTHVQSCPGESKTPYLNGVIVL